MTTSMTTTDHLGEVARPTTEEIGVDTETGNATGIEVGTGIETAIGIETAGETGTGTETETRWTAEGTATVARHPPLRRRHLRGEEEKILTGGGRERSMSMIPSKRTTGRATRRFRSSCRS